MPLLAQLQEADCIGCTKCIQACPVDAIIGAAKQMHSILTDECIGCGLCVEPCPMNCIDMQNVAALTYQPAKTKQRHQARKKRLAVTVFDERDSDLSMKKATILAAVARSKLISKKE